MELRIQPTFSQTYEAFTPPFLTLNLKPQPLTHALHDLVLSENTDEAAPFALQLTNEDCSYYPPNGLIN
jgi:hypothetical protein